VSLVVALTGGAASGKSTVARMFVEWGATLIDSDALVRDLQQPGQMVYDKIVLRFGEAMLGDDGEIDRAALRRIAFADPTARADLESIVHPAVASLTSARVAEARHRGDEVVIVDIPLLFEVGDPAAFDAVITVDAPRTLRRRRLIEGRGLSPDVADGLMASQLPPRLKRERADFVIENNGTLASLRRRVEEVWRALRA
jgi:dephospho-CoA kinase